MNSLAYVNWFLGLLLQVILLTFMVRRNSHRTFPRFFSYVLFQILKSVCLFVAYRYFPDNYFEAYWTANALSVLFSVAVMDEILRNLFEEYGGIQVLGATIFRWSCVLLLLVAVTSAFSGSETGGDRMVAGVFAFERSMRLMQVGIFLLLMMLCRVLKNCWRQQVFGIALGFGVFASIELILVCIVMRYGDGHGAIISLLKSTSYNAITLVWVGYLSQEAHLVPRIEPALRPNTLDMALATPAGVPGDAGFMLRVEQAVDRVLSRGDWPRPAADGSRVISRKPSIEESN